MGNPKPPVSIGLPVYNGEKFLEESIESILTQSFQDFELVISDNASTDRTPQICRTYAAQDNRIKYHQNKENIGHTANVNRVVRLAQGKYYRQHHDDDVLEPECLARCVEVLEAEPQVVLCHTKTTIIDEKGDPRDVERPMDFQIDSPMPHERFDKFLRQCYPTSGLLNVVFGLIRREALLRAPLEGAYPHADAALYGGLTLWGTFHVVDERLFRRRDHPGRSMRVFDDDENLFRWLNPKAENRQLMMPHWRALQDLLQSIWLAPVSIYEKMHCLRVVWKRYIRHFHKQISREGYRGVTFSLRRRLGVNTTNMGQDRSSQAYGEQKGMEKCSL